MGKKEYNFREFFHLAASDNPRANKKAVCLSSGKNNSESDEEDFTKTSKISTSNLLFTNLLSSKPTLSKVKRQAPTQDVFNFIMPTLKLPNRHVISDQILSKASTTLTENILQRVRADKIGVTAAFDG
ncbi:3960_t:CDS:2 [Cetraspora pellucida]|uniref:3960_t:CDS:1 n=1 Tax=Cetraspora pellucida TaxID=1433469 RepID=A0A9N9IA13_9GLOM|nr:3960_t:CDS:2 [Cetraspora pellucida]